MQNYEAIMPRMDVLVGKNSVASHANVALDLCVLKQ